MKLQLALDVFPLPRALELTRQVRDWVDIIEIGTPFLLEWGMQAVRQFRQAFPDKEILADAKIMDAGELEASAAFEAGADYVTVLAVTDLATVQACVDTANRYGRAAVADMICVEHIPRRVEQLEALGIHGLAVHTGVDQQRQGRTPLDDLALIQSCRRRAQVSVAGGITLEALPRYAALKPDILIVGGSIANAPDPARQAERMAQKIRSAAWDTPSHPDF